MKGYKGFKEGLICREKQYAENTIFEEKNAEVCESGIHFCENPLDVLDYYELTTSEFAEVEALEEVKTEDWKKYCTKKLKIGKKLSLTRFVEASVDFLSRNTEAETTRNRYGKLAASGYRANLAASGYRAQLAASGYSASLAASGDESQLAASGNYAQLAASGDHAKLASNGYRANLAASGYRAKLAASGDYTQVAVSGENCVAANIGEYGIIKGKKGTWITLARYDVDGKCVCVKSAQIDGDAIKENTWYKLQNGEFKETKK